MSNPDKLNHTEAVEQHVSSLQQRLETAARRLAIVSTTANAAALGVVANILTTPSLQILAQMNAVRCSIVAFALGLFAGGATLIFEYRRLFKTAKDLTPLRDKFWEELKKTPPHVREHLSRDDAKVLEELASTLWKAHETGSRRWHDTIRCIFGIGAASGLAFSIGVLILALSLGFVDRKQTITPSAPPQSSSGSQSSPGTNASPASEPSSHPLPRQSPAPEAAPRPQIPAGPETPLQRPPSPGSAP